MSETFFPWIDVAQFFMEVKTAEDAIPAEELAETDREGQIAQALNQNVFLSEENIGLQQELENTQMENASLTEGKQQSDIEAEEARAELESMRQEMMGLSEENKGLQDEMFNLKRSMDAYRQDLMDTASQDPTQPPEPTPEEIAAEEEMAQEEPQPTTKQPAPPKQPAPAEPAM